MLKPGLKQTTVGRKLLGKLDNPDQKLKVKRELENTGLVSSQTLVKSCGKTRYSLYFSTFGFHPDLLVDHRFGTKPRNSTNPKPYSEYNRVLEELPVMSQRTVHVSPSSYISEDWEFITAAAWEFTTNILGITLVFYYGIKQNQDLIWSQIASILLWARGWLQKRPSKGDDMTVSIW